MISWTQNFKNANATNSYFEDLYKWFSIHDTKTRRTANSNWPKYIFACTSIYISANIVMMSGKLFTLQKNLYALILYPRIMIPDKIKICEQNWLFTRINMLLTLL